MSDKQEETTFADKAMAAIAAAIVVLAFALAVAIPTAIAAIIYLGLRPLVDDLKRPGLVGAGALIAAITSVATLVGWPALVGYLKWIWALGPGSGGLTPVPVAALLGLSAVMLAARVAVIPFTDKIRSFVPLLNRAEPEPTTIVPKEEERATLITPVQRMFDPNHAVPKRTLGGPFGIPANQVEPSVPTELLIGTNRKGEPYKLSIDEIKTHVGIFGATGSGKTETILTMANGAIEAGYDVVMLDLKEDTSRDGLRDRLEGMAHFRNLGYQETSLSSESPNWFNVLLGLGPDEARDAIVSMQKFETPYYEALNKKLLGQLVQLFYAAHKVDPTRFPAPDIYSIGTVLSQNLGKATKEMRAAVVEGIPGYGPDSFDWLKSPPQAVVDSAPGLGARLTSIFETDAGTRTLRPAHMHQRAVDVTAPGVTYIGLNSLGLPDLSRAVSSAVLLRLAAMAGQRAQAADKPRPKMLICDESNFLATEPILNLLSRARSAGLVVVLCSQSPMDFELSSTGDVGYAQLAQNINVTIAMRQAEPRAAEMLADIIGKTKGEAVSYGYNDGERTDTGMVREQTDYLVPPEDLQRLRVGEAVVKVGVPEPRLNFVKVRMVNTDGTTAT